MNKEFIEALKQHLRFAGIDDWFPFAEIDAFAATWAASQATTNPTQDSIQNIMHQAQVFASTWSLVGSKIAPMTMADADEAKAELRRMLEGFAASLPSSPENPENYPRGNDEPIFHLRSHGDVTAAQLRELTKQKPAGPEIDTSPEALRALADYISRGAQRSQDHHRLLEAARTLRAVADEKEAEEKVFSVGFAEHIKELQQKIDELKWAKAVPEGWVLMPKELPDSLLGLLWLELGDSPCKQHAKEAWAAMLAAAPHAPKGPKT